MSEQGRKYDDGKLRYDLIPVLALEETAKVVTKGAEKYDDENWKLVPEGRRRYLAAALRHIQQWRKGEIYDEEMGTHHIANAISNLMFILEKELQGWEDIPEQKDISQEELKTYVNSLVQEKEEGLWYPSVEDGGNPWIEHTTDKAPTGINTVEWLLKSERDQERYDSGWDFVEALAWDGWDTDRIVAYRVV